MGYRNAIRACGTLALGPSQVVPPKDFQPKNDDRRAEDRRPEHYAKRCKCLIPSRGQAGDQLLNKIQLVHHLGEVIAGLGRLSKGELFGI